MSRVTRALIAFSALLAPALLWWALRHRQVQAAPTEADAAYDRLIAFEALRRNGADFARLPTWDRMSGPDPYVVRRLPDSDELVGVLRGSDAVVVLDRSLREIQRLAAPERPVALTVADDGTVFVAGELSTTPLARYRWKDGVLVAAGRWELDGVRAIRDIATGPGGFVYLVEEHEGRLMAFRFEHAEGADRPILRHQVKVGNGPIRLERVGNLLIADCLLDHALVFWKLEPSGALGAEPPIRIVHDGPIWSFAARPLGADGNILIAAGGAEDHPLDRTIGAFGYIDSFLYLYRVDVHRGEATREAAINLSELGVITPKAITLETSPAVTVIATGYGSDKLVRLEFEPDRSRTPKVSTAAFVPGAASVATLADGDLAFADPLLDAWVRQPLRRASNDERRSQMDVVSVFAPEPRSDEQERLGEALFFTTLMAPWNRSDGPLSRFTCETCHYEGYVDGRIHHTGRGEVHAVTKPLLGLWNNRPHFSRALDDDLVAVAFNEFRVAGAKSDHDPWFSLHPSDAPWLSRLGHDAAKSHPSGCSTPPGVPKRLEAAPAGDREETLDPALLRKALMSFLMAFNHRPNPMVLGRTRFSDDERAGAVVFRDRCESCHEARLASDAAVSRVPFERWQDLVLAREGAIVWGKAEYAKTGVEPYVHEKGARVPSLRRLYKKRPYFTNGSAKDLDAVLIRARILPDGFRHAPPQPDDGATLDERSRAALLAFLDLL